MTRVAIVGPRRRLEAIIDALHQLRLLDIVDHRPDEEDGVGIGSPLPRAGEASEDLVRLRSIRNTLTILRPPGGTAGGPAVGSRGEIHQRLATLEINLREEEDSREKVETLLTELEARIEALRPYAALPLPLEAYRGYGSLAVLAGRLSGTLEGLDAVTTAYEAFRGEGVVAIFAAKDKAREVEDFLGRRGFQSLPVPREEAGDPRALLTELEAQRSRWQARLVEVEERMSALRERYADFLLRAERVLEEEVEKAEAPLRFAVTDHSFAVDGWVPTAAFPRLRDALAGLEGVHVAAVDDPGEPPVRLRNPRPVKPFEMFLHLFSTPRHEEVDPTPVLFLIFPVFFGLMIGDLGYGIVMMAIAFLLRAKVRDSPDLADLFYALGLGGFFALLFGLFLYGELFGIPFHGHAPEELSWALLLHWEFLPHPVFEKLHDVVDLLLLSIVASFVHLGVGYVFGIVNEVHHSRKHAVAKFAWLLNLIGLFYLLLFTAYAMSGGTNRLASAVIDHPVSPFAYLPQDGAVLFGLPVSFTAVGLLGVGVLLLLATEGGFAVVEVIGLLANMVSYTRIAGVAVAKGSVALAFNSMLVPLVLGGDVAMAALGFVFLFLAHLMILILGGISASVQGIRLNYVEFFLKFYKGGGRRFRPFGWQYGKPMEV